MKKLDIINELKHIQEVNRTTANVLTTILRQLEKEDKQPKKKTVADGLGNLEAERAIMKHKVNTS